MSIREASRGLGRQAGRAEGREAGKPRDEHAPKTRAPPTTGRGSELHCPLPSDRTWTNSHQMCAHGHCIFLPLLVPQPPVAHLEYGIAPKIKGHCSKHPWSFLFPVQTCLPLKHVSCLAM